MGLSHLYTFCDITSLDILGSGSWRGFRCPETSMGKLACVDLGTLATMSCCKTFDVRARSVPTDGMRGGGALLKVKAGSQMIRCRLGRIP